MTTPRVATRFDNLTDLKGMAKHFNVSRQAAHNWTCEASFPKPIVELNGGRVWMLDQITAWHEARTTRRTG